MAAVGITYGNFHHQIDNIIMPDRYPLNQANKPQEQKLVHLV